MKEVIHHPEDLLPTTHEGEKRFMQVLRFSNQRHLNVGLVIADALDSRPEESEKDTSKNTASDDKVGAKKDSCKTNIL